MARGKEHISKRKEEQKMLAGNAGRGSIILLHIPKGSFGKRFQMLDGYQRTHNRDIDPNHRDYLVKSWERHRSGLCTLIQMPSQPNGQQLFYIVDGQHRISAASITGGKKLLCEVYPSNHIPYKDLQQWVADLNTKTKNFRSVDFLRIYKEDSYWPLVFAKHGAELTYANSTKVLTWATVIRAFGMARDSLAKKRLSNGGSYNSGRYIDIWLNTDTDEIERVIEWYNWWNPIVKEAQRRQIKGFAAYRLATLSLMVWEENKAERMQTLQLTPERILRCPELPNLMYYSSTSIAPLAGIFMKAVNYKGKVRLLTLLGDNGRD